MVCSVGMLWALSACQRPAAPCGHNWHEVSALVARTPTVLPRGAPPFSCYHTSLI